MAMHKLLVYDDYPRRGGVIGFCERPAAQQRDARGLEVVRANDGIESAEPLVRRQFGLAFDSESNAARSRCRQVRGHCYGLGTRKALEASKQIFDEEGLLRGLLISCVV